MADVLLAAKVLERRTSRDALKRQASRESVVIDGLLDASSADPLIPSRYECLLAAFAGLGTYGGATIYALYPVLIDAKIGRSTGWPEETLIFSRSAIFLAWAVGSVVLSLAADRYGRKPVVVGSVALHVCAAIGAACAREAGGFFTARAIGGFALAGMSGMSVPLLLESVGPRAASRCMAALNIHTIGATCALAALHAACARLHLSWRFETLALAGWVGAFGAAIAIYSYESPHFIAAAGDTDGALRVVRQIAQANGVRLPDECGDEEIELISHKLSPSPPLPPSSSPPSTPRLPPSLLPPSSPPPSPATPQSPSIGALTYDLFVTYGRETVAICLAFLSVEVAYYAIAFNAGSLSRHLLFNFVAMAILDIPGYALGGWLATVPSIGARRGGVALFALSGGLLLLLALVVEYPVPRTSVALIAKMVGAGAFQIIYLLPARHYPLRMSAAGLGLGTMFARLGGMLGPALAAMLPMASTFALTCASTLAAAAALALLPSHDAQRSLHDGDDDGDDAEPTRTRTPSP